MQLFWLLRSLTVAQNDLFDPFLAISLDFLQVEFYLIRSFLFEIFFVVFIVKNHHPDHVITTPILANS